MSENKNTGRKWLRGRKWLVLGLAALALALIVAGVVRFMALETKHGTGQTGNSSTSSNALTPGSSPGASSVHVVGHRPPSATTTPTVNTPLPSSNRRVYVPFFAGPVPFNQTAIFWFGDVSSSDTYTDVRIGYNASELYLNAQIVDRYLWYDTNAQAPDLSKGDNITVYLNTGSGNGIGLTSYRFQAGVNGYTPRANYQYASRGTGAAWAFHPLNFTADYGWRGQGMNGKEDRGWTMTYHIPFSTLGMAGAPSQGTLWKLAVRVHNRDDAANTPLPDKWWPETGNEVNAASWGDLVFGIPAYQPPAAGASTVYTIRNGLNGQTVVDGMVGGSLGCGNTVSDVWTQLENTSYPGAIHTNIQNEADISDWNCFSKWYMTFPLSSLPHGKAVLKATVTLYEYGNAGVQGQPNPSYIQVAMVRDNWNPATLTWNNAPLIQENIGSREVDTKSQPVLPWPGLAVTWDVSRAVAEAAATGQPLRLVFYSTDNQYNTGKYFTSSSIGAWDATGRPTLQVTMQS